MVLKTINFSTLTNIQPIYLFSDEQKIYLYDHNSLSIYDENLQLTTKITSYAPENSEIF